MRENTSHPGSLGRRAGDETEPDEVSLAAREISPAWWTLSATLTDRRVAATAVAVVLLGTCVAAILVHASLYADGANYLLQVIEKRGYLFIWWDRSGTNFVTQTPLVIGIHLGLHSMQSAVLLYSLGVLGIPVFIYLLALFFSRREWYLVVVAAVIITIYATTFFMSVSESVTAYAIVLLMATILASSIRLSVARVITLLLCSIVLPFLYETSVILGPLLTAWCIYRFLRKQDPTYARVLLFVPALAGIAASATSAWAILHPIDSQAEQNAGNVSGLFISHEFDAACLVLIGAVALALAARRASIIAAGEATLIGVAALFTAIGSAPPQSQYTIRLAPAFLLVLLFIVLWKPDGWKILRPDSLAVNRRLSCAVLVLVVALAIQNATLLAGWHGFFSSVRHQVNTAHGLMLYSQARLELGGEYGWPWTFPTMSRIAQDSPRGALIENPDPSHWQPFNPAKGSPRAADLYWHS